MTIGKLGIEMVHLRRISEDFRGIGGQLQVIVADLFKSAPGLRLLVVWPVPSIDYAEVG